MGGNNDNITPIIFAGDQRNTVTSFRDYHYILYWLTSIGQGYLISSHWTPYVIHQSPGKTRLSPQVWNFLGNDLILSFSKKWLSIIRFRSRVNPYGWRSSTNDFSFGSETEITFKRYILLPFSRCHNVRWKKTLKEFLRKHKERRSSLPSQRNPPCLNSSLLVKNWKFLS
jgi:hypothetical protein